MMDFILNGPDVNSLKILTKDGRDLVNDLQIMRIQFDLQPEKQPIAILTCIVDSIDFKNIPINKLLDINTGINVLHSIFNHWQMEKQGFSRIN